MLVDITLQAHHTLHMVIHNRDTHQQVTLPLAATHLRATLPQEDTHQQVTLLLAVTLPLAVTHPLVATLLLVLTLQLVTLAHLLHIIQVSLVIFILNFLEAVFFFKKKMVC